MVFARHWSLRVKFIVFLLVASLIPLGISALIDVHQTRQRLWASASALLVARGDQLAAELDAFHQGRQQSANILSRLPDLTVFCANPANRAARSRAREVLNLQQLADSTVWGSAILDRSGRVMLSTEAEFAGRDLSYYAFVRQALLGTPVISDIHLAASAAETPTIAYLAPIRRPGGQLCGVAALWVRAQALWDIARASNELAGAGSFAALVDSNGIRIGHTYSQGSVFHPTGALDSSTVHALLAEARFGKRTGEFLADVRPFPEEFNRARAVHPDPALFRGFAPVNQKWNLGVGRRLATVPWTTFYMIPQESLEAQVALATRSKLLTIGGTITLVLLGAALFAAVILTPIGALTRATDRLAKGDFSARVSSTRDDEIGRLGSRFNAMAERIESQSIALHGAREKMERRVEERTADLARVEAHFRVVVESAPSGIVLVGQDGNIVLVNREIERLFGYGREELLGQPVELLVPRGAQERHSDLRTGFVASQEIRPMGSGRDLFGRRKDGQEIAVEIGLNPIKTEDGLFVLASVIDLSARKLAEARFRTVVESAPSGMVMVGRDGKIVLVNQEVERLFGYGREELLGQSIELLIPHAAREGHPGLRTAFFARPEARSMGAGRDLFGRRKDGVETPVEIGLTPIETEEGLFVLASVVDISARKKSEEELRRSNEELERFAYVASHDLQEPLRTVTSYVQLLARRYRDRLDQDALEFIDFAVEGSKRMQRLIEDLLSFSRVGTRVAPLQETDVGAIVDLAFESVGATATEAQATLTRDALPVVLVDPAQLEQVFTNLISNALKFRGDRAPVVHVGATRAGAFWEFRVRDNGIGIKPEYFERIFIIFQRLHTRQQYAGTGIGLAICKKVVERHGGRIWVESDPDQGTTFVFTLRALS